MERFRTVGEKTTITIDTTNGGMIMLHNSRLDAARYIKEEHPNSINKILIVVGSIYQLIPKEEQPCTSTS